MWIATPRLLVIVHLFCFCIASAKAEPFEDQFEYFQSTKPKKNIYATIGLAGPILQFQGFYLLSMGYKFSDTLEVTLSTSNGGQASLYKSRPTTALMGQINSLGLTYFVDFIFQKSPEGGVYIRSNIAQQSLKCYQSNLDQSYNVTESFQWNTTVTGLEFEIGAQGRQDNLIFEFSPAIAFIPLKTEINGEAKDKNYIPLRILNFRAGLLF